MFFITCFETLGVTKIGSPDMGDVRTFGFKETFDEANRALNNNVLDMWEGCYNYAIVEEMYPGIHPNVENRWFYKYNKELNGFFSMDEPEEFKHFTNIALG